LQLNLQDAIVIIDEGHNINNVCETSSSLELSPVALSLATRELDEVLKVSRHARVALCGIGHGLAA
jgi:Rad3-related DNA helicase